MKTNEEEARSARYQRSYLTDRSRSSVSRLCAYLVQIPSKPRLGYVPHHGKRLPSYHEQSRISVPGSHGRTRARHPDRTRSRGRPPLLARLAELSRAETLRSHQNRPEASHRSLLAESCHFERRMPGHFRPKHSG